MVSFEWLSINCSVYSQHCIISLEIILCSRIELERTEIQSASASMVHVNICLRDCLI